MWFTLSLPSLVLVDSMTRELYRLLTQHLIHSFVFLSMQTENVNYSSKYESRKWSKINHTNRPGPSPRTVTRTFLIPLSNTFCWIEIELSNRELSLLQIKCSLTALIAEAVVCAAMFVPFLAFLNPSTPHDLVSWGTPEVIWIDNVVFCGIVCVRRVRLSYLEHPPKSLSCYFSLLWR